MTRTLVQVQQDDCKEMCIGLLDKSGGITPRSPLTMADVAASALEEKQFSVTVKDRKRKEELEVDLDGRTKRMRVFAGCCWEGPDFPALGPIPRQAHWGYPVAGSTVTEAQLKVVGDKGLDPGAMVNAGWWFEPRLPRSASETYRWTATNDEQMEDWRPGLPSVESEIGPDWPSGEPRTAACASNDLSDHRGDGVQTAKYRPWCSHRHINIISRRC